MQSVMEPKTPAECQVEEACARLAENQFVVEARSYFSAYSVLGKQNTLSVVLGGTCPNTKPACTHTAENCSRDTLLSREEWAKSYNLAHAENKISVKVYGRYKTLDKEPCCLACCSVFFLLWLFVYFPLYVPLGAFHAFDKDGDGIIKLNVLEVIIATLVCSSTYSCTTQLFPFPK